jgi:phosphorylcholine metabolism protein LicD
MKPSLPVSILEEGLSYWWPKISELEGIPFFGTLLGLVRNGRPIDGDDDVDFLLPMTARSKLIELIHKSEFRFSPFCLEPDCEDIIQVRKDYENHELIVDFYFYSQDLEDNCVVKWHFFDARFQPNDFLRFSKKLIKPKLSSDFESIKVALPKQSKKVVKFLYGRKWKKPLIKDVTYEIFIVNGKPEVKIRSERFFDKLKIKRES